jgi:GntR family galactonate operon transcriptional repressor
MLSFPQPTSLSQAINAKGLHRQITREIALVILRGNPREIERLPATEADLSKMFGVSRTILREAVKVLACKGLLEARPRIGIRVLPRANWRLLDPDIMQWQCQAGINKTLVRKLCQIRLILEPASAADAAIEGTMEEVRDIHQAYQKMEKTLDNFEAYVSADVEFHRSISRATHNEFLLQMNQTIFDVLGAIQEIHREAGFPASTALTLPFHGAVADAIVNRDPEGARVAMQRLVRRAEHDLEEVLQQLSEARRKTASAENKGSRRADELYSKGAGIEGHLEVI